MKRTVIWSGEGEDQDGDWHVEFAEVEFGEHGLRATGVQLGAVPIPYRLDYRLDATGEGFVTRSLLIESVGQGWERRLRLERDDAGEWTVEVGETGEAEMPGPGGDPQSLAGALDCDLGLSPLTNAMPVHRHSLHRDSGAVEFTMAWVSVPDLGMHASHQRYSHVSSDGDSAVVRFEEIEGSEVAFTSDLVFADDGLVRVYPKLARRITA